MNTASPTKKTVSVRPENDPVLPRMVRYCRYGLGYLAYSPKPSIWPAIWRKMRDKILGRIPGPAQLKIMRDEGEAWCLTQQTSTVDGLRKLGIFETIDVVEKYQSIFKESEQRAGNVPVWLDGGSNLNLLYTLCDFFKPNTIVETGVGNGWSSLTFLLYLKEHAEGRLLSGDLPVLELRNDKWVGIAVPENLRDRWSLFRMADREALPKIARYAKPFDLVYYDSDKSMEGRRFSYMLLWRNLKPGGVFIANDIDDNTAFAHFCVAVGVEPIVVKEPGHNAQGILIKP